MHTDESEEDNFTVSLIQLVGILFCIYYISRGVLQENRQELVVFVLTVSVVMIRSVVNFVVLGSKSKQELLVRFACIMCLGVVLMFCTMLLILRPNMMAFRVGGALERLQEQYFLLNLCFSMVTFDLQAQLCLCILIMTSDSTMSANNSIILGVGVVWACLTAAVGVVAVLKEAKVLVWVFMVQNLPQVAFFVYLMYTVSAEYDFSSVCEDRDSAVSTMRGFQDLVPPMLCTALPTSVTSQDLHTRTFMYLFSDNAVVSGQHLHTGGSCCHRCFDFTGD
ncbi:hypothetical protein JOB18_003999 [Solea senegalensis]|uniref:DUF7789 domain-containing protein n=1 Tax=Solea senegalensis TaxID=28829 RepID=A0AAV6SP63_SOLSE|nr:hypothetical protein JOB18_003999 [Solea senegalensis]